jgi:hypothetical protein
MKFIGIPDRRSELAAHIHIIQPYLSEGDLASRRSRSATFRAYATHGATMLYKLP